jgi:hypothetical protein
MPTEKKELDAEMEDEEVENTDLENTEVSGEEPHRLHILHSNNAAKR